MKKERTPVLKIAFISLGFAFLIGVWYLASYLLIKDGNYFLPYPHETVYRMGAILFAAKAKDTWVAIGWTILRILIGFGGSFVLAAILGTISGLFPFAKYFLKIPVAVARAVPTAAVVIVLAGAMLAKPTHIDYLPCILCALVTFPLIYEAFISAIVNEDEYIKMSLDLDGGWRRPMNVVGVLIPDGMPFIKLSIAQTIGLSFKVTIMSEVLTANSVSHLGIGSEIVLARSMGNVEDIIAYALIALIMMLLIDLPFILLKFKPKKD